jgi:hypothetical protein
MLYLVYRFLCGFLCGLTGSFDPGTAESAGRATLPLQCCLCSMLIWLNSTLLFRTEETSCRSSMYCTWMHF